MKATLLVLGVFSGVSFNALSDVGCPEAKIEVIHQTDGQSIVKLEGQSWHLLGNDGDADLDYKLGKLLVAKRKGQKVKLFFPDGYDSSCQTRNVNIKVKDISLMSMETQK